MRCIWRTTGSRLRALALARDRRRFPVGAERVGVAVSPLMPRHVIPAALASILRRVIALFSCRPDIVISTFYLREIRTLTGKGIGGLPSIEATTHLLADKGPRRVSPFFIPGSLINLVSGLVSIEFGFKGPNHSVVTACSTGAHAIGDAARIVALDDADVMIAGGTEAAISRIGYAGFQACKALSTHFNETPEKASRPYDIDRDGFVMGEGAGVVVLEEYEHAKARGATIYAEVVGYGMSGDAYHITAPAPDGGYRYPSQIRYSLAALAISEKASGGPQCPPKPT